MTARGNAAVATTLLGSFFAAILFGCSDSRARLWQWLPLIGAMIGGGLALHLTRMIPICAKELNSQQPAAGNHMHSSRSDCIRCHTQAKICGLRATYC
eukprot:SAG31_NODE_4128_length_3557_cov_1.191440_6_plen_98_part_00